MEWWFLRLSERDTRDRQSRRFLAIAKPDFDLDAHPFLQTRPMELTECKTGSADLSLPAHRVIGGEGEVFQLAGLLGAVGIEIQMYARALFADRGVFLHKRVAGGLDLGLWWQRES